MPDKWEQGFKLQLIFETPEKISINKKLDIFSVTVNEKELEKEIPR
jgi:uncharacterized protein YneR